MKRHNKVFKRILSKPQMKGLIFPALTEVSIALRYTHTLGSSACQCYSELKKKKLQIRVTSNDMTTSKLRDLIFFDCV